MPRAKVAAASHAARRSERPPGTMNTGVSNR
jgi:hypothetical protein